MWYKKYFLNSWTKGGRVFPKLDCWGLVCDVYKEKLNIKLDEYTQFCEENMTNPMLTQKDFIKVVQPKNYDVACWIVNNQLVHVGIFYQGFLLHCDRKFGTLFQEFANQKNIVFYRHKGLIDAN